MVRIPRAGLLAALALPLAFGACSKEEGVPEEILSFESNTTAYQDVAARQEELLKKIDEANARVDQFEGVQSALARNVSSIPGIVEQTKHDLVQATADSATKVESAQQAFLADLSASVEQRRTDMHRLLSRHAATIHSGLAADSTFFQFVFTDQDSINEILGTRLNARPWYRFVVSPWKEPHAGAR